MDGFTFYFCIGKYSGWKFEFDSKSLRIVCGWVAVVIVLRDIEQDMEALLKVVNQCMEVSTKSYTPHT